jgi:hypothetical protein
VRNKDKELGGAVASNSVSAKTLAREVLKGLRGSFEGTYEAATKIARVYEAIGEEKADREYSNAQVIEFFEELKRNGIGPGAIFLKENNKGQLKKAGQASTYSKFSAIGSSNLFRDPDVRKACLISGYDSLYALTILYQRYCEAYSSGSIAQREEGARKKVLKLLKEHGAALTRASINATMPVTVADASNTPQRFNRNDTGALKSIRELVDSNQRYDFLLITPDRKTLDRIDASDTDELERILPLTSLRNDKSDWMLAVDGALIESAMRFLPLLGDDHPKAVICILEHKPKTNIVDITKQTLVMTSKAFPRELTLTKRDQIVRVAEELRPNAHRRLHLFAEDVADGWEACAD